MLRPVQQIVLERMFKAREELLQLHSPSAEASRESTRAINTSAEKKRESEDDSPLEQDVTSPSFDSRLRNQTTICFNELLGSRGWILP